MGTQISQESFSAKDYQNFAHKLNDNLSALKTLLEQPGFGQGPSSVGAELEFYIVNDSAQVLPINQQLAADIGHPQLQVELNRFNIEYNLKHQSLAGRPFSAIEKEMSFASQLLNQAAMSYHGMVVPIGILPTLSLKNFSKESMTDLPRYRALSNGLKRLRGKHPFTIDIGGCEPLAFEFDEVTLEGANTSCQFHWRVAPQDFSNCFNAMELVTPIVLGLATNSPTFLGHHLWEETRIALFKQAVDTRQFPSDGSWIPPSRVSFGDGWVRHNAWEIFARSVAMHPPLLPVIDSEDPLELIKQHKVPKLHELRLHQGTIWSWNRAIYDSTGDGHLRIEMRALPAGPTWCDMAANAALSIGLAGALQSEIEQIIPALPFKYAKHNFYQAAQFGLDAKMVWPGKHYQGLQEISLPDLALQLLPKAADYLNSIGVDGEEITRLFDIIKNRISHKMTGARWQLHMVERFGKQMSQAEALQTMLQRYIDEHKSNTPVHEWSLQL